METCKIAKFKTSYMCADKCYSSEVQIAFFQLQAWCFSVITRAVDFND